MPSNIKDKINFFPYLNNQITTNKNMVTVLQFMIFTTDTHAR